MTPSRGANPAARSDGGGTGRARRGGPPILAFSGPSGVGKTTLLVKLLPRLVSRGLTVGALKSSGHVHPFDRPAKDSARLRRAGALAVALQGPAELAYFGPPISGGVGTLAQLLPRVDLVVAEGFKGEPVPRIEVHRTETSPRFLCARDRQVIAVVSDVAPPRELPWFTFGKLDALAEFVATFARLGRRPRTRALAARHVHAQRMARNPEMMRENEMVRTVKTGGKPRGGRATRARGTAGEASAGAVGRPGPLARRSPKSNSRVGRQATSRATVKRAATSKTGPRGKRGARSGR